MASLPISSSASLVSPAIEAPIVALSEMVIEPILRAVERIERGGDMGGGVGPASCRAWRSHRRACHRDRVGGQSRNRYADRGVVGDLATEAIFEPFSESSGACDVDGRVDHRRELIGGRVSVSELPTAVASLVSCPTETPIAALSDMVIEAISNH